MPAAPEGIDAVAALAARSGAIYDQIKSLSEDKDLAGTARTFAKVDRVIETLERDQRRIADELARQKKAAADELERQKKAVEAAAIRAQRQKQEEEERKARTVSVQAEFLKKKEESKAEEQAQAQLASLAKEKEAQRKKERAELDRLRDEEREAQLKAEVLYQQAQAFFRQKEYDAARERLTEVTRTSPDYKDTVKLIIAIDRAKDEAVFMDAQNKDGEEVRLLAEQATAVNLQVLDLSQKKDYGAVEQRFGELEGLLVQIKAVKERMRERREEFEMRWEQKTRERQAEARGRLAPKGAKDSRDTRSLRQEAVAIFREGQQLYTADKFAEARIKFLESARVDPTYKAAMTYITRIDRILAKRDFEVDQEKAEGADATAVAPDPRRALLVSEEGARLYKTRRYREARIKFEELSQIGDDGDKRSAAKYLDLIDQALEREKKKAEDEKRAQKERFLQERRNQAKLQLQRDQHIQDAERRKIQGLAAAQKKVDIRRQQELRAIERENYSQRRNMIEKENREFAAIVADSRQEHAKFTVDPMKEDQPSRDIRSAQAESEAETKQAGVLADSTRAGLTDPLIEDVSRDKIMENPGRTDRRTAVGLAKEDARSDTKAVHQARQVEAAATDEQQAVSARVVREAKKSKRTLRREEAQRQAADDAIKQKRLAAEQAPDTDKGLQQQELIRRNQQEVAAILNEPLPAAPEVKAAVLPEATASVAIQDAVAREKKQLEEQRQAIRKDFEEGVDRLYQEAVDLYKKRSYDDSLQSFTEVDGLIKGYKKTGKYLKDLERLSPKAAQGAAQASSP